MGCCHLSVCFVITSCGRGGDDRITSSFGEEYRLSMSQLYFLSLCRRHDQGSDDERQRPPTSSREGDRHAQGTGGESTKQITSNAEGTSIPRDATKSTYNLISFKRN